MSGRWSVGNFVSLVLHVLTHDGPNLKIISLYTLRVVCFWRVGDNDKRTECTRETEIERRRNLFHSLLVVAFLWCSLGILVTINVTADGVERFYGPAGYCKLIYAL